VDVSPSGAGTVKGDQTAQSSYPVTFTFRNGTSVSLEAIPAPGYQFNNWSGDLSGTTNPATIAIDCTKKITANFSWIMHTLTIQVSGSGFTTPKAGTHSYSEGTVLSITASPDNGWQFDNWSGDVADPESATTTVTMDSDKNFTANFSQIMHTLTIQVNGSGFTTPRAGTQSYNEGTVVSITASPDDGWQFDNWSGDVADPESATTTVTMDSDKNFTANFSQVKPSWWLIGGSIAGVIIFGVIIWLVVRSRMA